ncbi:UPF0758 domain-containing protein [Mucilaginibacter sp. RCC_168]|uniref:UPF0758 domain-containing protein n=1 Tax=Mucilaginibacter sp. RCC_168 TaxID=3239221 RepID=UPI0035239C49
MNDQHILAEENFSYRNRHFYVEYKQAVNHSHYLSLACVDARQHRRYFLPIFEENLETFIQALCSVFRTAAYRAELRGGQGDLFKPAEKIKGIKSWEPEARPREKLMEQGREAMSDAELLAMLICAGLPGMTAVDLAEQVLGVAGHDLKRLAALGAEDLMAIRGIGHARALSVISAMELAVRLAVREQPLHFLKLIKT